MYGEPESDFNMESALEFDTESVLESDSEFDIEFAMESEMDFVHSLTLRLCGYQDIKILKGKHKLRSTSSSGFLSLASTSWIGSN